LYYIQQSVFFHLSSTPKKKRQVTSGPGWIKKRQVTRLDASLDLSASRASKAHCTDGVMGAPAISKASVDRDFHAVLPASEAIMINISFIQLSIVSVYTICYHFKESKS